MGKREKIRLRPLLVGVCLSLVLLVAQRRLRLPVKASYLTRVALPPSMPVVVLQGSTTWVTSTSSS
jgi:hypothetical protein